MNDSKKRLFIKVLIIATIAFAIAGAMSACGQTGQAEDMAADENIESTDPVTGGWELVKNDGAALPEDVQAAFDKAAEKFTGSELTPVAYVAKQIVAGTNHMILCEEKTTTAEPSTSYQMIIVYEDLEGNAEITNTCAFDPTVYTEQ